MTIATDTATIIDLSTVGQVDLSTMLTGPLRQARLVTLDVAQVETLSAAELEHTVFVLEGVGTAQSGSTVVQLGAGTAVTIPQGGTLTLSSGPEPLRYFHASLMVPAADREAGTQ
jgi:mannose-6-phosphate isomerase-like protein (cupin superfamily)